MKESNIIRKVALGAAGIGMPYGSHADDPLIPESGVERLLDTCWRQGMRWLDTAPAYGESEHRIGNYLARHPSHKFYIATKVPSAPKKIWSEPETYLDFVLESLSGSLTRLQVPRINLLQFHQSDQDFLKNARIPEVVKAISEDGRVDRVGASLYQATDLAPMVEAGISTFQVPVNIVNQAFLEPSLIEFLHQHRCEIIIRSVFLQGLLHEQAKLPSANKRSQLAELKSRLTAFAHSINRSLEQLALDFVIGLTNEFPVLAILLGMNSEQEANSNFALMARCEPISDEIKAEFANIIATIDPQLADPRTW